MGYLLLIIMISVVAFVASGTPAPEGIPIEKALEICPPHKWRYVETKDNEGNVVNSKLACELCGPLMPIDNRQGRV